MNVEPKILERSAALLALLLSLALAPVGLPASAADQDPAAAVAAPGADPAISAVSDAVATPAPDTDTDTGAAVVAPDSKSGVTPERTPARRHRLSQMVEVGGSATVRTNQVTDGVVVVRGDARIEGEVDGDVVVVLGNVRIDGTVNGDVVVVMGEAAINGKVTGDVTLVLTRGRVGEGAEIRGDMVAAGVAPEIHPSATLRRDPEIISFGPLMKYFDWAKEYLFQGVFLLRPFPPGLGWVWIVAALCLALNLLVAALFPGPLRGCMDTLRDRPARSFLVGFLTCVLVGPVSVLLSFAIVATPLIWLAYFALCVVGRVAVYGAAGRAVLRSGNGPVHPFGAVLVGSLIFYVGYMIPVLGFLVYWFVLPWGVGAALIRLIEAIRGERRLIPGGPGPDSGRAVRSGDASFGAASALAGGAPGPATHAIVGGVSGMGPQGAPVDPGLPRVEPAPPRVPPVVPGGFAANPMELAYSPRVGFWPRIGALLIDVLAIGFIVAMTFETAKAFWFLLGAYHLGMWTWKGTTLGGSVLGLRVVRTDGRALDWQTAAYRMLGAVVSLLPLGLGFIWVAWDPECQSWHDRIAGTTIVKPERRPSLA